MPGHMPQEIQVWYIIPAIRKELARSMIEEFGLKQKEVAEHMDLSEAAVSQYLSSKRAKSVTFSNSILDEIKKSAEKIKEDDLLLIPEMMRLCRLTDVTQVMCDIHRAQYSKLPENCDICFDNKVMVLNKNGIQRKDLFNVGRSSDGFNVSKRRSYFFEI